MSWRNRWRRTIRRLDARNDKRRDEEIRKRVAAGLPPYEPRFYTATPKFSFVSADGESVVIERLYRRLR